MKVSSTEREGIFHEVQLRTGAVLGSANGRWSGQVHSSHEGKMTTVEKEKIVRRKLNLL